MTASDNVLDHIPKGIQALMSITTNPTKQALAMLEAGAVMFDQWAENVHLQPWKDVQTSLIKLEVVFNIFDTLIQKIEQSNTPAQIAVHKYYAALKNLQEAMEDHVFGGMMHEKPFGQDVSEDEVMKILNG